MILAGVSGSGKTTVGRLLADRMGWPFADGDSFHPAANVAKAHQNLTFTTAPNLQRAVAVGLAKDDAYFASLSGALIWNTSRFDVSSGSN